MMRLTRSVGLLSSLLLLFLACPRVLTVEIVEPRGGTLVRGTIAVRARASGPETVVSVELLADGLPVGLDSTGTGGFYEFALNAVAFLPDTTLALVCVARDVSGATDTSAAVAVRVFPGTRHSGEITAPETWDADGNPHIVEDELLVEALLRIEPGVEVQLAASAGITVGRGAPGALQATGSDGRPVRFTSFEALPAPGDWRSLSFRSAAGPESCWLRNCVIEYGGGASGMVHSRAARLFVEGCSLRWSSGFGAVAESSGFARFSRNHVTGCALPVRVEPGAVGQVATDNVFAGNERDGVGVTGGVLSDATAWDDRGWPWCVLGTITVAGPGSPAFTISAGCTLLFADSAALRVGVGQPGALTAISTGGNVVFGPLSDAPTEPRWPGIEIWQQADPARTQLSGCTITGGGLGRPAALTLYAPAVVTGSRVTDAAGTGIWCSGAGFTQFGDNTITGCAGYPLSIEAGWLGTVGSDNSFTGNGRDTVEVRPGSIARTSQWRNPGVPYFVTGMVEVGGASAPTLVIDNGARLVFGRDAGIAVGRDSTGRLAASGLGDSITFTGTDTVPGSWRGIGLYRGAGSQTRLERCRLLYGGRSHPGIVHVSECAPIISQCEIGWSANHCVVLTESPLDPDSLLDNNWIHDPAPDYDEVYEEGFGRDR